MRRERNRLLLPQVNTEDNAGENATKTLEDMLLWQGIVSDRLAQNTSMRERFGMRISDWLSSAALSAKGNDTGSMLRAELWILDPPLLFLSVDSGSGPVQMCRHRSHIAAWESA